MQSFPSVVVTACMVVSQGPGSVRPIPDSTAAILEPLDRQSDDIREAAADNGDERVLVLNAIGPRLPLPAARVEIVAPFRSLSGLNGRHSPRPPDPFVAIDAIEADARDHMRCCAFLKPDHPLGVGTIERFVEDLAIRRRKSCRPPGSSRPSRRLCDLGGLAPRQSWAA